MKFAKESDLQLEVFNGDVFGINLQISLSEAHCLLVLFHIEERTPAVHYSLFDTFTSLSSAFLDCPAIEQGGPIRG